MRISEIFDSIQGEGPAMGTPCTFVRFSGCNLRCRWCDTPESSWNPTGKDYPLEDVLRRVEENPGRLVVITGGEPFIHGELSLLCSSLRENGHPVHLETAGTVFQNVDADLICISPKLEGTAPSEEEFPDLFERHETNRFNAASIEAFLKKWPSEIFLKFVVEKESDIQNVRLYLERIRFQDKSKVFLMAQSRSLTDLEKLAPRVAEWCVREGFRYSDRLHVRLWPGERGR